MAIAAANTNGNIITHYLCSNHGQCFALGRVYLARHDGTSGLVLRQPQFAQTGAWAAAHEADVVGDLVQCDGQQAQAAMQAMLQMQKIDSAALQAAYDKA